MIGIHPATSTYHVPRTSSLTPPQLASLRDRPANPDHPANAPALDPLEQPRDDTVTQIGSSPQLRALDLETRKVGLPVGAPSVTLNGVFAQTAIPTLGDLPGRNDPVFSSPLYRQTVAKMHEAFDSVRAGPNPGDNAKYIEELARQDPMQMSMSIVAPNGAQHSFGDDTRFSIQSISKMYILAQLLRERGPQAASQLLGSSYSDMTFGDITTLSALRDQSVVNALQGRCAPQWTSYNADVLRQHSDPQDLRPANASINFGALQSTRHLDDKGGAIGVLARLVQGINHGGRPDCAVHADTEHQVFGSEIRDTGSNQTRMRVLMLLGVPQSQHHRYKDVPLQAFQAMEPYISACALRMSARTLAASFAGFVDGRNPFTGKQQLDPASLTFLQEQMAAGGAYEDSLRAFTDLGFLIKTGVGGGIAAICPITRLTIALHSTRLDDYGNSARSLEVLRRIAELPEFQRLRQTCLQQRGMAAAVEMPQQLPPPMSPPPI